MSSKVDVWQIIVGHIDTLANPAGKRSIVDCITFFGFPLVLGFIGIWMGFNLNKDIASMLVNFGAIFTALLLSVLVLVYEQESRLRERKDVDPFYFAKKKLLNQLYYNICYSIICSIVLVAFCFAHSIFDGVVSEVSIAGFIVFLNFSKYVFTPLVLFVTANLMLTIVMIVKRMHAMLII